MWIDRQNNKKRIFLISGHYDNNACDRYIDGQIDRQMDRQMDKQIDRQIDKYNNRKREFV